MGGPRSGQAIDSGLTVVDLTSAFSSPRHNAPGHPSPEGQRSSTVEVNGNDIDLEALYERQQSWPELAELLLTRAEEAATPHAAAEALTRAAEIFGRHLNDPEGALVALQQAFTIYDELALAYSAQGCWSEFVDTCWRHAAITPSSDERARLAFEAGRVLQNRLGRSEAAEGAYNEALTNSPAHLNARRGLVGIFRARREVGALAESLWELADLSDDHDEKVECWTEAASLLRDNLNDAARANEIEARLAGLSRSARATTQQPTAGPPPAPISPSALGTSLRSQAQMFANAGDNERALNATAALAALGQASREEHDWLGQAARSRFVPPQASLSRWPKQIRHPGQSEHLSQVFAQATPAFAALHAEPLQAFGFSLEPSAEDTKRLQHPYVLRLRHLARCLAISLPRIVASPRFSGFADLVVIAMSPRPLWVLVLGQNFFAPQDDRSYAFRAGKLLAQLRPEHLVTWPSVVPSFDKLHALANEAVVAKPEDITGWLVGAALTMNRAGLLTCGDLAVALAHGPPPPLVNVATDPALAQRDLVAWSLSNDHAALRQSLLRR